MKRANLMLIIVMAGINNEQNNFAMVCLIIVKKVLF